VWAVGGSGENQVNDAVISGASYLIGLGIMFLLFIALVVVLAILVKMQGDNKRIIQSQSIIGLSRRYLIISYIYPHYNF